MASEAEDLTLLQLREAFPELGPLESFSAFDAPTLFAATSAIVRKLLGEDSVPVSLPTTESSATRFKSCSAIARCVSDLGYTDVAYNNFMYPNEGATKAILAHLIGKLASAATARTSGATAASAVGGASAVSRALASLRADVSSLVVKRPRRAVPGAPAAPKTLAPKRPQSICTWQYQTSRSHVWLVPQSDEERAFVECIPILPLQIPAQQKLAPTVDHWNTTRFSVHEASVNRYAGKAGGRSAAGRLAVDAQRLAALRAAMAKASASGGYRMDNATSHRLRERGANRPTAPKSRFALEREFAASAAAAVVSDAPKDSAADREAKLRAQMEEANARLNSALEALRSAGETASSLQSKVDSMADALRDANDKRDGAKAQYDELHAEMEAAKNFDASMAEIQAAFAAAEAALAAAQEAWAAREAKFQAKLDAAAEQTADVRGMWKERAQGIQDAKDRAAKLAAELGQKDEEKALLEEELSRLPQHVDRSGFLKRIMDLIRSLRKLSDELSSTMSDIRDLQKEMNVVTDTLRRSTDILDRRLQDGARNDEWVRKVWHNVIAVREQFDGILSVVDARGTAAINTQESQDAAERLRGRLSDTKSSDIAKDVESVRAENEALNQKIKELVFGK